MNVSQRVSVIIPVYNEVRTISSVIEIVRTWGKAVQIIAVNDGSTDKTLHALRKFTHDITILTRTTNKGKGYSLAQGIKEATGDLLMFLDGDLVGLTHKDLDALLEPVLSGQVDMTIGITNCWGIGTFEPFNQINGERVLHKKSVLSHLDKFKEVGNGVEFIINDLHKRKKISEIKLPYVYILSKSEKAPIQEAMLGYVKEAGQFLKAIVQMQTDTLTPQTRKVFRIAQSYIKRALDYLNV